MKHLLTIFLLLCTTITFAQHFRSGYYENGLVLAYDSVGQSITGYFEDATGWDEATKAPMFTCSFYIEGKVMGNKAQVLTYYPQDKATDTISGTLELLPDQHVLLTLREEHGGCANVHSFASNAIPLAFNKPLKVIQVKYAPEKMYFYGSATTTQALKDFIPQWEYYFVEKIIQGRGYGYFMSERGVRKGYVKL